MKKLFKSTTTFLFFLGTFFICISPAYALVNITLEWDSIPEKQIVDSINNVEKKLQENNTTILQGLIKTKKDFEILLEQETNSHKKETYKMLIESYENMILEYELYLQKPPSIKKEHFSFLVPNNIAFTIIESTSVFYLINKTIPEI